MRSRILADATVLIALGQIGELDLLTCLNGGISVVPKVESEVTTEPANTNLENFLDHHELPHVTRINAKGTEPEYTEAKQILGENEVNGDVQILTTILTDEEHDNFGVISDDQRVRTVSRRLGATVTGTVGIITRAVDERNMTVDEGKDLVRRVDSHGLHMTGELREKAYRLVEKAVKDE
jgi:predicted nucleic acid-binding protein